MIETTITRYEIEDSDYDLLKTWVPEDPCPKCGIGSACCGCKDRIERDAIIKPLKAAGVFEVQQKVQEVKELQRKLKDIERIIASNKRFIAGKGFDLNRVFEDTEQKNSTSMATMNAF